MSIRPPKAIRFRQGDSIIEEGDTGNSAFIIRTGEVEVYKVKRGRNVLVGRLGPDELIGEICLFQNNAIRTARVVAFTDVVEVVELNREDFKREVDALSPRMRLVLNALIQRLNQNYTQIAFLS